MLKSEQADPDLDRLVPPGMVPYSARAARFRELLAQYRELLGAGFQSPPVYSLVVAVCTLSLDLEEDVAAVVEGRRAKLVYRSGNQLLYRLGDPYQTSFAAAQISGLLDKLGINTALPVGRGRLLPRREAIRMKTNKYWSGRPCQRGHIGFRKVKNRVCLTCQPCPYETSARRRI